MRECDVAPSREGNGIAVMKPEVWSLVARPRGVNPASARDREHYRVPRSEPFAVAGGMVTMGSVLQATVFRVGWLGRDSGLMALPLV